LKGDLVDHAVAKFDLVDVNDFTVLGIPILRGGNDTYTVRADDTIIDEFATLDVNVVGGSGTDVIDFSFAAGLDGLLKVRLDGGAGNDTVKAVIEIDDFSIGTLDAKLFGGKGNDTLTLKVFNDAGNNVHILNALADGGAGTDSFFTFGPVTAIN